MGQQLPTRNNIRFEEPLSELLQTRITLKEKSQIDAVAKTNYITSSELIRNLIREHIHEYACSINLKISLEISNQIDRFLIENRLISARNDTNISKMREILTDFEALLEESAKNFDEVTVKNKFLQIVYLTKLVYESDLYLAGKIDAQLKRIYRNKHVKCWNGEINS